MYPACGRTLLHPPPPDEKGEVKSNFHPRFLLESQVLPFTAALPERSIARAVNFFLATQGFLDQPQDGRPVYVAGESFEVSLRTLDAEGKTDRQQARPAGAAANRGGREGPASGSSRKQSTGNRQGGQRAGRRSRSRKEATTCAGRSETDRFDNVVSGEHAVHDLRRRGPRAAANPRRPPHVQGRRCGQGADPLA